MNYVPSPIIGLNRQSIKLTPSKGKNNTDARKTAQLRTMNYALKEVGHLQQNFEQPISVDDVKVWYVCALFAELAYYHIPAIELGKNRRAKVIPCFEHEKFAAAGVGINVIEFLRRADFQGGFVFEEGGVVSVVARWGQYVFAGFRGTRVAYDWFSNLAAWHTNQEGGWFHRGFFKDSVKISNLVASRIQGWHGIKHVFLSGHSLGGAVASIAETQVKFPAPVSVVIFGAPRHCNQFIFDELNQRKPPSRVHVRRKGDIVPELAPRALGYADYPYTLGTDGTVYPYPDGKEIISETIDFAATAFEPHSMEHYRHEIGVACKAHGALNPLLDTSSL